MYLYCNIHHTNCQIYRRKIWNKISNLNSGPVHSGRDRVDTVQHLSVGPGPSALWGPLCAPVVNTWYCVCSAAQLGQPVWVSINTSVHVSLANAVIFFFCCQIVCIYKAHGPQVWSVGFRCGVSAERTLLLCCWTCLLLPGLPSMANMTICVRTHTHTHPVSNRIHTQTPRNIICSLYSQGVKQARGGGWGGRGLIF